MNVLEMADFRQFTELIKQLEDEPFVKVWEVYCAETEIHGAYATLLKYLPQFSFPIKAGISNTEKYKEAVLRGNFPIEKDCGGLSILQPESFSIRLHNSAAGCIAVLFTSNRADFVTLVRALAHRNEPITIPDSMGACMVKGFNNWNRIHSYRAKWSAENLSGWDEEFQRIKARKELYQDRFLILSDSEYSNVPAEALDLQPIFGGYCSHAFQT